MEITSYSPEWADEIAKLFHRSVHAIDSAIYTPEQKEAWAPTPPDYEYWSSRLTEKRPFIALMGDRAVGFIELDADGHIDCAYTHPDFQRRGIASALFDRLLEEARDRNLERLYVEASHVARPFFEHRGFSVLEENEITRNGVILVNYSMEMRLGPDNRMQPDMATPGR